ncbi:MAG: lysophospholipase [Rhodocyclaceae bacterium]|nr:lysophospholipase [Rhodocyclaceae bacterium]
MALFRLRAALASAALCFLVAGCAGPHGAAFGGSRRAVEDWAKPRGFHPEPLDAGSFRLFALRRQASPARTLTVYIEGDGAPWPSVYRPPSDPTPPRPIALALADRDPATAVAYLGRPCQYLDEKERDSCDVAYWSGRRHAEEVLRAMNEAVDRLKQRAGVGAVRLVGHSGGGVIAALLAQRRGDVAGLITIAAPLALSAWTTAQRLTPLAGSVDPLAQRSIAAWAAACHFVGAEDAVVPPAVVRRFVQAHGGRMEIIDGFEHDCCWVRDWDTLLRRAWNGGTLP